MGKVLVLGSDNRSFLSVVRSLGRRGLDVHVGWCPPDAPARHSRYIRGVHDLPGYASEDERWKQSLTSLMRGERFDLVLPCDDPTLIPLQRHKSEVGEAGLVYVLSDQAFEIAFDKLKSYELARSLGVPVPRARVVSHVSEMGEALSSFMLPVVIKPRATFTSRDLVNRHAVRRAGTWQEVTARLQEMTVQGEVLVQENFIGTGVGVEVLADRGDVLLAFQHVRIHEPPMGGGSSYRRSVPLRPELAAAAERLVGALQYTGVAMVEFRVNFQTGAWVFVEINGRFWGSLPLALAAGADFPYFLYQLLVHSKRDFPRRYRTDLFCRNLWLDAVWMQQNFRGDRSDTTLDTLSAWAVAREAVNVLTFRERSDTFVLDDPKPGCVELAHLMRTLWRRAAGRGWLLLLTFPLFRKLHEEKARRALRQAEIILFVCKGNICRSPFAQYYAQRIFPASVTVRSCGYYPKEGRACPQEAVAAARTMGVELPSHRSRVLSDEFVRNAQAIFTFDEEDYATVTARYPFAKRRVHPLGLLASQPTVSIKDPYGGNIDAFKAVYKMIARALDACAQSLAS